MNPDSKNFGQSENPGPESERSWCEEDLLQWILDERVRNATPRAELERDGAAKESLQDLERFVADCRVSLTDERVSPEASELEREILAMTTREDLGLRGDMQLVGRFVRRGLHTSMLLRVVAASLLLHIAALPVLAFISFLQPDAQETLLTFGSQDLAGLPYSASDSEVEPDPVVSEPEMDLDPASVPDAAALFTERLIKQGLLKPGEPAPTSYEAVVWGDELGLVLWAEQQLDEAAASSAGEQQELRFALQNLSDLLSTDNAAVATAVRRLATSSWKRAQRAGWTAELGPEFQLDASRLQLGDELRGDAWAELYLEAEKAGE